MSESLVAHCHLAPSILGPSALPERSRMSGDNVLTRGVAGGLADNTSGPSVSDAALREKRAMLLCTLLVPPTYRIAMHDIPPARVQLRVMFFCKFG